MQQLVFLLGVVLLIKRGTAYSLDGHHHPAHAHPPPPPPQYDLPEPPPPHPPVEPVGPVPPLCSCYVKGRCDESLREFTDLVIRNRATEIVCGSKFEMCCFKDDPWPGVTDSFSHLAPCVPDNLCARHYGISPTDVRDYGVIGQCPGLGSVRCLDGFKTPEADAAPEPPLPIIPSVPEGPQHFVFPILEDPIEPKIPVPAYQPPEIYQPPVVVYHPPSTEPPPPPTTTEAPTTIAAYDLPDPPVVSYEPPQVYVPEPEPPAAYLPPSPAYLPPSPSYLPPKAVPEPTLSYGPPKSVEYYSPSPPVPEFQHQQLGTPLPQGYAYTSRFGYPYGYSRYGGYYPGLRFRLRKYFGVGFLG